MDDFSKSLNKMASKLIRLVHHRLPIYAGRTAIQHFQKNFVQGGFVNGGLHPWPEAKRLHSSSESAASQYRTLLSSRKRLYSSFHYTTSIGGVTIYNDAEYAKIHQEGGVTHPRVTPKMRKYAWARYYASTPQKKGKRRGKNCPAGTTTSNGEAEMWKRLALTKKKQLTVNIPARPFMGESIELSTDIDKWVEKEVINILIK